MSKIDLQSLYRYDNKYSKWLSKKKGASYLNKVLILVLPRSTIRKTSPVFLLRCHRKDKLENGQALKIDTFDHTDNNTEQSHVKRFAVAMQ